MQYSCLIFVVGSCAIFQGNVAHCYHVRVCSVTCQFAASTIVGRCLEQFKLTVEFIALWALLAIHNYQNHHHDSMK